MTVYNAIETIENATSHRFNAVAINLENVSRETALERYGNYTLENYSEWEIMENLEDFCRWSLEVGYIGLDTMED